jgi:hypothetical protein
MLLNINPACSSLGQNLSTSTYVGEIAFSIIIATLGLVLFGLLIGNMQVSSSHFYQCQISVANLKCHMNPPMSQ